MKHKPLSPQQKRSLWRWALVFVPWLLVVLFLPISWLVGSGVSASKLPLRVQEDSISREAALANLRTLSKTYYWHHVTVSGYREVAHPELGERWSDVVFLRVSTYRWSRNFAAMIFGGEVSTPPWNPYCYTLVVIRGSDRAFLIPSRAPWEDEQVQELLKVRGLELNDRWSNDRFLAYHAATGQPPPRIE